MTDQISFLPMLDDAEHPTWLLSGKPGMQNENDRCCLQEDGHRLYRQRTFAEPSAICVKENKGRMLSTFIVLG